MNASFRWLHLTDFHLGMKRHGAHWPVLEAAFFEDVERIQKGRAPIDAVIFTGDLVNKGTAEEFDELEIWLKKLWATLDHLGSNPVLVAVPGNHDLIRPPHKSSAQQCLTKMWRDQEIQDGFWNDPKSDTRKLIGAAFKGYSDWWSKTTIPKPSTIHFGGLPGDFSTTIEVGEYKVGIVGLNSAFLHLADILPGNLAISIEQLNGLCGNHAPEWQRQHDASLLLTHHPMSWLDSESKQFYEGDLYVPSHFSAHLFGHMHCAEQGTFATNGAASRTVFQGDSLFGLEKTSTGELRSHGYCFGEINFSVASSSLRFFPRTATKKGNGSWAFDRHPKFVIDDDNGTAPITLPIRRTPLATHRAIDEPPSDQRIFSENISVDPKTDGSSILALTRTTFRVPPSLRHLGVRSAEQESAAENLQLKRATWICADWGMGAFGFIWSILTREGKSTANVYRLSLAEYKNLPTFLVEVKAQIGCSFQQFCKALAALGSTYLVFEEVPNTLSNIDATAEQEIERLADMVLSFCPNTSIILLTRQHPKLAQIPVTTLKPLDEADTRTYIMADSVDNNNLTSKVAIREIYRHTGGVPDQIDETIDSLKFISIGELGSLSLEFSPGELTKSAAPRALVLAVAELKNATDKILKRAYGLLLALTILPHGETIERIKRFARDEPYFPLHANELFNRGLIEVATLSLAITTKEHSADDSIKLWIAPKPVRDYILSQLDRDEVNALNKNAASLYFGPLWTTSNPKIVSFSDSYGPTEDNSVLNNIRIVIQRLLLSSYGTPTMTKVLSLAIAFCTRLREQKQYLTCATSTADFLRILPTNEFSRQRDHLELTRAMSLRMIGTYVEARDILLRLSDVKIDKDTNERIRLNLAMCYQSMGDKAALTVARELIKSSAGTKTVFHAREIILEMSEDDPQQAEKLKRLEREARKNEAITAANNIALFLANKFGDAHAGTKVTLQRVVDSAAAINDVYTKSRAAIKLGTRCDIEGTVMEESEILQLIDAYHYVYNQRFDSLFNSAHEGIWNYFEKIGDTDNLLKLFRNSSFIWRLHSCENRERPFIERFQKLHPDTNDECYRNATSEIVYFRIRQRAHENETATPSLGNFVTRGRERKIPELQTDA